MKGTVKIPERVVLSALIVILMILLLAACGKVEVPLTVPAGARAGDLVDMQSCTYKGRLRQRQGRTRWEMHRLSPGH